MKKTALMIAGTLMSLAVMHGAYAQQQSGQVASGPPEDIALTVTLADDGTATLSESEFHLAWGGYYRFNLVCPPDGLENETSIRFSAPDLWENSHLRIVSVSDTTGGLKGGPDMLERAKTSYLQSEYSGQNDRRPRPGRVTRTEI